MARFNHSAVACAYVPGDVSGAEWHPLLRWADSAFPVPQYRRHGQLDGRSNPTVRTSRLRSLGHVRQWQDYADWRWQPAHRYRGDHQPERPRSDLALHSDNGKRAPPRELDFASRRYSAGDRGVEWLRVRRSNPSRIPCRNVESRHCDLVD